jgi:hypothetical protein
MKQIRALLTRLCLLRTWLDDSWYDLLYRRFRFVRKLVWKRAGRKALAYFNSPPKYIPEVNDTGHEYPEE